MTPTPATTRQTKDTDISLREFIEARLAAMEKAIDVANRAMELRLNSLDEIGDALRDRNATYITKAEFRAIMDRIEGMLERMDKDVRILRESKAMLEGKASQASLSVVTLIAVIGLLISLVNLVMRIMGA